MFIGVGVGAYWAGAYHLLTHAFFKAALFLGSGSVILACHHEQDMRKMGGLGKLMPVTKKTYLWACIAIAGFPIASGFYSKDEILWKAFQSATYVVAGHAGGLVGPAHLLRGHHRGHGHGLLHVRSYYMTFTGEYRGGHDHGHDHGHGATPKESPLSITSVLVVLASGAVLASLLGLPASWTHRPPILEYFLEPRCRPRFILPEHPHWVEWLSRSSARRPASWAGCLRAPCTRRKEPGARAAAGTLEARLDGGVQQVLSRRDLRSHGGARLAALRAHLVLDRQPPGRRRGEPAGEVTRLFANLDGAIDK